MDPHTRNMGLMAFIGVILLATCGLCLVVLLKSQSRTTVVEVTAPQHTERTERERTRPTEPKGNPPRPGADEKRLVLLKETLQARDTRLGAEITGTVENRTGKRLRYVEIRFTLHDKSGAQVGSTFTNTTDLEDGAKWNFRAFTTRDFETYKVTDLTGG